MKTSLRNNFIEYITDKHFIGLDYNTNNTYYKNKSILDSYLKICNKLNVIDKLDEVIEKQINPLEIIYEALCEQYKDEPMPEMIDDSYHVSKQSECLALNTLNGYTDIDVENSELINDFINTVAVKNTALSEDIKKKYKQKISSSEDDEDIERAIVSLKTNIISLKHADKKYPIFFGWLFESMMYYIIYDFIHVNNKVIYSPISDTNNKNISSILDIHKEAISKLSDETILSDYIECAHKDVDYLVTDNKCSLSDAEKYICLGLHDVINEQKHINKDNLIETYEFLQVLTNEIDDQYLGYASNIEILKTYVDIILIPQIDHFLNTYITTVFKGKVIDIIRKPSFNYGIFKGEGDYILVIEAGNERLHVLADAKCYTKIQKLDCLCIGF